jgi:carbonic anhydrase/acetyltransferase-like protein (isoleucine patch superfamily)
LVGIRASVLDGAVIPSDTMIGAGGLVTPGKQLKSGYLYMGSPVKAVRELTDDELAFLKISAQNYITLKDKHLGC